MAESSPDALVPYTTESIDERQGRRRNILDKLKPRSSSTDFGRRSSNESNSPRRLSKLVPSRPKKKSKNKERQSSAGLETEDSSAQESGGRSPLDGESGQTLGSSEHPSVESFEPSKSVGSSLITSDSDLEDQRPGLASRPSHAGYLTLTSPLIASDSIEPLPTSVSARKDAVEPVESFLNETKDVGQFGSSVPSAAQTQTLEKNVPVLVLEDSSTRMTVQNEAPATFITPPTPELPLSSSPKDDSASKLFRPTPSYQTRPMSASSSRSNSPQPSGPVQHRRAKSSTGAASKLSTSSIPPLTPTVEEVKSPGGTLAQPSSGPSAGFFSSVFSATQNAVSQISNSFASNPTGQRSRSATESSEAEKTGPAGGEEVIVTNSAEDEAKQTEDETQKEPAVATLGSGDLSLSHLGIMEAVIEPGPASAGDLARSPSIVQDSRQFQRSEAVSAADAISAAYADKPITEKTPNLARDSSVSGRKPLSVGSGASLAGDATPPRETSSVYEGSVTRRTDSMRSRLSDRRKRRRNSAMATTGGGAISAAIGASTSALLLPGAKPPVQRPPGVTVASSKRNKDFHLLFRSVPEDDLLIEDYSAALQRDILLHGRLYISDHHICFSSNILGWVTNLVMNFDEVVSTEKKSTAVIFPNAIVIQTLHAKNVFASLLNRDATYDLLISMWRISHPNLKITEHGHTLDNSSPAEKPDVADSIDAEDPSDMESDEFSVDDDDDDDDAETTINGNADATSNTAGSEAGDVPRGISQRVPTSAAPTSAAANGSISKSSVDANGSHPPSAQDFPGPTSHAPTECSDQETHYDKQIQDTVIPAPLGKVYTIMFGPSSGVVMRKFLIDDQKSSDLQMEDDKKGMGDDAKSFSYSFIKPLSGSIGPKQTKCIVSQSLDAFDLEQAVSVTCSTQTPDVPNGNIFVTKTKYCLMWAPGNSTRLLMSSTVEWSGKSWLKGPIEKGASDGQIQYGKDLAAFLKGQVAARSPSKLPKGKVKSKKRKGNGSAGSAMTKVEESSKKSGQEKVSTWGALEPLRALLGPVADIVGPLLNTTVVLLVLLAIVTMLLASQNLRSSNKEAVGCTGPGCLRKLASYESIWAREENELWKWLEDRVGADAELPPLKMASKRDAARNDDSKSFDEHGTTERQLDEAIRVTQNRLDALKSKVELQRVKRGG